MVHGARMPLRRSAATKVMVFQCPCGTRSMRRSPRGQRPYSRTIFVFAAVSSMKTRRAGSNMPCSRIQRRRARATSARCCSAARRLFFERNFVALKETPDRGAAARNAVLVHRQNYFIQRQVRLLLDQPQQKVRMLLQRRDASAPWLGYAAATLPKALDPDNRCTGTDLELLRGLAPRSSAFDFRNYSLTHVSGISPRHCPAPKSESMTIDSPILRLMRIPRFNRGGTCSRTALDRSGTDDPDAHRRLRFCDSLGASAMPRGASKSCLSLALRALH